MPKRPDFSDEERVLLEAIRDLHPSEVPPWIRTHRRLTPEEEEAMKRDIQERWGDYYDYA
jgi:hypothetical protein